MNVRAQMKGQMLIGGEMVAGEADKWIESVNPANEERIGEFVAGDAFFNVALRTAKSVKDAFAVARELVLKRELRERFEPSNPQMAGGANVEPLLIARP